MIGEFIILFLVIPLASSVLVSILFSHKHELYPTGRQIFAKFGKHNLPDNVAPIESLGLEYGCLGCPAKFIKHDAASRFPEAMTELEPTTTP